MKRRLPIGFMFSSEAEMCDAFLKAIKQPWVAYAETQGWDILLVHATDGRQIGIQAKLKLNAKVLTQAAETHGWWALRRGPDYRAVLIPEYVNRDLEDLAAFCSLTVIKVRHSPGRHGTAFFPSLEFIEDDQYYHQLMPSERLALPEFIPDVRAGMPSPRQLTTWKIGVLKLSILLAETGYLTRADFRRHKIDIRRFIGPGGSLRPGGGAFVATERWPDFRAQHPVVWNEIAADPAKWARTDLMAFAKV